MRRPPTPIVLFALALLGALALAPNEAHAQQRPDPRRDRALMRGRTTAPSAGEVLLWVPRVVFFPLYVVTEYGIRVPVRAISFEVERSHIPSYIDRVLHPHPDFRWSPTFIADLGLITSAGLSAEWDNAGVRGHRIRASGSTGGRDFIHVAAEDRWVFGPGRAGVRGDYLTRPDRQFFGLGPRSEETGRSHFTLTRRDIFAFVGWVPTTHAEFELSGGYRHENNGPGDEPSIETVYAPQSVPGFGSLSLVMGTLAATINSRHVRDGGGSGVRFSMNATMAQDTGLSERRFWLVEAEIEGALEIVRPDRLLFASVYAADSAPMGSEPVPFTHLPALGRTRHQGFRWGRFRDQSAFVAEVAYRYPIWNQLDWVWLASMGNVFGTHFQGFDARLFTGSFGAGFRSRRRRDSNFEVLFALGTGRVDEGFGVESFRLYFGIERGL